MPENKELTLKNMDVIMPAVANGEEALAIWAQYQDIIQKVCIDVDYQMIEGNKFRKKSGWRKIATFFNLSVDVTEERMEVLNEKIGHFAYHFTCKATAPNGRYAVGTGSCDSYDKKKFDPTLGMFVQYNKFKRTSTPAEPNTIHNVRSTAETRAFNRCVSNLVGGGEVSAEEVEGERHVIEADSFTNESVNSIQSTVNLGTATLSKYECSSCGLPVDKDVFEYSSKFLGRSLCRSCQAKEKKK